VTKGCGRKSRGVTQVKCDAHNGRITVKNHTHKKSAQSFLLGNFIGVGEAQLLVVQWLPCPRSPGVKKLA
jgi:hypothetical protein